jgi:hypothetical protein
LAKPKGFDVHLITNFVILSEAKDPCIGFAFAVLIVIPTRSEEPAVLTAPLTINMEKKFEQ